MNPFDIVVAVLLISAAVSGFKAGLLRSAVTILAYLIADTGVRSDRVLERHSHEPCEHSAGDQKNSEQHR